MSRPEITENLRAEIVASLPTNNGLRSAIRSLYPTAIALEFGESSLVPVAAVCFQDCIYMLSHVHYALFETAAHVRHYAVVADPPNTALAVYYGRFYLDSAITHMYSAAEHLAAAIHHALDVEESELNRIAGKSGSMQRRVGKYLQETARDSEMAKVSSGLVAEKSWNRTIDYRHNSVHSQPPILRGTPDRFVRQNPWVHKEGDSGLILSFPGYAETEFTFREAHENAVLAYKAISTTIGQVFSLYRDILKRNGVQSASEIDF